MATLNGVHESCQGLRKAVGMINSEIHEDIKAQRAKNIAYAQSCDQLPMQVERRLQEIVAATFSLGPTGTTECFRIAWPGQERHMCSSAYWIKRNRRSHTFEVVRGTKAIDRFARQTGKGELYANLAEAIENDLDG